MMATASAIRFYAFAPSGALSGGGGITGPGGGPVVLDDGGALLGRYRQLIGGRWTVRMSGTVYCHKALGRGLSTGISMQR